MSADEPRRSLGDTLRQFGATLLALVHTRAELAVLELQEEAQRRKQLVILGAIAAVFFALGLLLLAVFIIVLFWDSHRLLACLGVTLVYLGIGAGALWRMIDQARRSPPPFAATLKELNEDLNALRGRHE
ncbi:MAG: phage holin family protein [Betaproteobacteria bacterium]|nr:phage holin family protein [Betaproteobacteria bacterium]